MNFDEKIKAIMKERCLSQADLCQMTGIGKSSFSQYINGTHEPSAKRKRQIANALELPENHFEDFDESSEISNTCINIPVTLAARLMGKSPKFVMQGLQDGRFPFGYGVKLKRWDYWISSVKFTEYTGIQIPINNNTNIEKNN